MTLSVEKLTRTYGETTALEGVSFSIEEDAIVGIVGPSGCGKTTLLWAIAGHLSPSSGRVRIDGQDVTTTPPERRDVGMMFQRTTLFPHKTVAENVAYGLHALGMDTAERQAIVDDHLELVGLADRADAMPAALSGGEARRIELARALAPEPDLLLLDEPLTGLDRQLRDELREEIGRIQRETGVVTLVVTHDQGDAMRLADRLLVMDDGTIDGDGSPGALYRSPPTEYVHGFLGPSSELSGTLTSREPPRIAVGAVTLRVPDLNGVPIGTAVRCYVRPEAIEIHPGLQGENVVTGTVTERTDAGRATVVRLRIDGHVIETNVVPTERFEVGDRLPVRIRPEGVTVFPEK